MSNLFDDDRDQVTYACPICGSTDLIGEVVVSAKQEPDGTWKLMPIQDEDLNWEMSNVNTEVRCHNDICGNPHRHDGTEIDVSTKSVYETWLEEQGLPTNTPLESLSADELAKWNEFQGELYYTPWSGVIADCVKIE